LTPPRTSTPSTTNRAPTPWAILVLADHLITDGPSIPGLTTTVILDEVTDTITDLCSPTLQRTRSGRGIASALVVATVTTRNYLHQTMNKLWTHRCPTVGITVGAIALAAR
jgi:hypothetical protein